MPKPNGSLIRSRRQELGIKTGTMAKTVGCSRQHLTNIESGWVVASIELLNRLANELDVPVPQLIATDAA